jgi:hypothetical protein
MSYAWDVKTNLSLVSFSLVADTRDDAIVTAELILDKLVIRDITRGEEVD